MTRPRVLLTGFGPFPGVPENASAALVQRLEAPSALEADITALVLPTEWHRGVAEAEAALAHFQPDIALHFGVSKQAHGFVIEELARNTCEAREDACGAPPQAAHIVADGLKVAQSTLPINGIRVALRAARIPVSRSLNAGGYLCNAVLYASLTCHHAASITGFIHMPAAVGRSGTLSEEQALIGGRLIIEACLDASQDLRKK